MQGHESDRDRSSNRKQSDIYAAHAHECPLCVCMRHRNWARRVAAKVRSSFSWHVIGTPGAPLWICWGSSGARSWVLWSSLVSKLTNKNRKHMETPLKTLKKSQVMCWDAMNSLVSTWQDDPKDVLLGSRRLALWIPGRHKTIPSVLRQSGRLMCWLHRVAVLGFWGLRSSSRCFFFFKSLGLS